MKNKVLIRSLTILRKMPFVEESSHVHTYVRFCLVVLMRFCNEELQVFNRHIGFRDLMQKDFSS